MGSRYYVDQERETYTFLHAYKVNTKECVNVNAPALSGDRKPGISEWEQRLKFMLLAERADERGHGEDRVEFVGFT